MKDNIDNIEITKNKVAIEGNNLYKKMIEEIQDYAIIMLDTKGIILNWNRGAEKIKLYKEEEIVGKHFSKFYLQQDFDNNLPQRLLTEAFEAGRASHEGWRVRKDGTKFWGSVTITALHGNENEVIGYCKVTRDLTDRKITEDNLRMSEERYHRMVAEVRDYAIILLSVDGVIENWNAGAEAIKGYSASEIIGKRFEIFYTPEDRAIGLPDTLLNKARETGKAVQHGWRMRKDKTKFWATVVITALHNNEGRVIGFSKVTRDLTQQKLTEEKLAAYTAELEIQNRELEQFAYVASHDLQEPLRKIQTFTDLLRENIDDKEFVALYFNKLSASAARMSQLVRSLLDYSKITKGDENVNTTVELNDILGEIKEDFELLIAEKHADIQSDNLPVIIGNKVQLGQLFSNLIGNSLKFSIIDPVIKISSKIVSRDNIKEAPDYMIESDYIEISFSDNGIGFEDKYKTTIFSLFKRLHGKQDYAGTGIGLAMCKKIVEKHKGHIIAMGELGKGATFKVYLPF